MLSEVEAYHRLHPELLARYPGQYVAIYHGQLIDRDEDPAALIERTEAKWPGRVIPRRKVESVPESVLAIRSPRMLSAS